MLEGANILFVKFAELSVLAASRVSVITFLVSANAFRTDLFAVSVASLVSKSTVTSVIKVTLVKIPVHEYFC